jgi:hypothetical protein
MDVDYTKLWKLSDALSRDALIVKPETILTNEQNTKLISGEWKPRNPVIYKYHMGRSPGDLIGTTFSGRYLLSIRVLAVLRSREFTGFSEYPVHLTGKTGREIDGYAGFAVVGRSGPPENARRTPMQDVPGNTFVRVRGLFFEKGTWDGSDFFLVETTRHICVTQPVYEAIGALKPKNIKFSRLDQVTGVLKRDRTEQRIDDP